MPEENNLPEYQPPVYPAQEGIEVLISTPFSVDRIVAERRPYTVRSYTILKIEENTTSEKVRVCVRLEDGAVLWLTALEGAAYRENVDYSQADLEAAIKQNLLTGKFEG